MKDDKKEEPPILDDAQVKAVYELADRLLEEIIKLGGK